ncbi:GNAT family N-acetyltransferase [Haloarchaeobius sp. TZWSO28]|uniref:GNAT family N-acetyltransferase n=1 Tax=Haloarchaeobius sp. TZWSO28 TaxID=3446119 RepID=UPI003EB90088
MFPDEINTPRLQLTPVRPDSVDVATLHDRLFDANRPTVETELRWLPWEPHHTLKETYDYIHDCGHQWDERERATYCIRLGDGFDEAGAIIGITYLDCFWPRRTAEMVMWTRKDHWNRGFMTEYGKAIHDLGFCDLEFDLMIADAIDGNDHAYNIFEHMTDAFDGQYDGLLRNWLPDGETVHDVHRFSITRQQYRTAMGYVDEAEAEPETHPAALD